VGQKWLHKLSWQLLLLLAGLFAMGSPGSARPPDAHGKPRRLRANKTEEATPAFRRLNRRTLNFRKKLNFGK
jgi:hypothetical protein